MKIAIASDGKYVSGHFGHCEGFTIYEADEKEIKARDFVENPGHRPGFLPVFLKDLDVDVIVAGGMGAKAQELFSENGIEVVVGAQGFCDDIAKQYIKGELESTESVCREHAHEGHCNE
ncbi:MAG TPA: dinitrogenase iron-molybdenum cofactor [Clostridiales bacterium]|nr:dinitrogenase iron-molybdenum cofactor [Clostridiales bacterium]